MGSSSESYEWEKLIDLGKIELARVNLDDPTVTYNFIQIPPGELIRRFELQRNEDETGISGTGVVAVGVEFPDGTAVLRWNTRWTSTAIYNNIEELEQIHGHNGRTTIEWID